LLLKRRMNCVYKTYPPYRTGDLVGVVSEQDEPILVKWLGIIDRTGARRISGAKEVALDFAGYQADLLSSSHWLGDNQFIVGCLIDEGALAVMDGSVPLVKIRRQPV